MSHHDSSTSLPHVGRTFATVVFVCTLIAFVVESEMTQYVQTTLGYRKPFFIFYIVHSSFAIIFPLHILYLKATSSYTTESLLKGLSIAIAEHMARASSGPSPSSPFPLVKFAVFIFFLTSACNMPGLLWFAAITLASVSDVTAIWNTNAFFAYLISVKVFHLQWEYRRLLPVVLATIGVLVVVYGGTTHANTDGHDIDATKAVPGPTSPLIGDLLTLTASIMYALYQVMYKKYAALPSDPELVADGLYEPLAPFTDNLEDHGISAALLGPASKASDAPPPPPFGFHPNFLTSTIGICTFVVLWIPIPILHYLDIEPFDLPTRWTTAFGIVAIALSGVVFNAGFMVLLAMWGPIMTSVGGLLTIVLVFVADILWGAGMKAVTLGSMVGSTIIVAAFAMLAYDMLKR